jgi:PIN domain nuclease of toxin-antitoxin system
VTVTAVADAHGFLWYFSEDPRLPSTVRSFIDAQRRDGHAVGVSSIALVEILYLSEKGCIPADAAADVMECLDRLDTSFVEITFDRSIVRSMEGINRSDVPDMPDRIIAATALHSGVPLISRDGRIRASNVETVW